jgi:hypothetical protein
LFHYVYLYYFLRQQGSRPPGDATPPPMPPPRSMTGSVRTPPHFVAPAPAGIGTMRMSRPPTQLAPTAPATTAHQSCLGEPPPSPPTVPRDSCHSSVSCLPSSRQPPRRRLPDLVRRIGTRGTLPSSIGTHRLSRLSYFPSLPTHLGRIL